MTARYRALGLSNQRFEYGNGRTLEQKHEVCFLGDENRKSELSKRVRFKKEWGEKKVEFGGDDEQKG